MPDLSVKASCLLSVVGRWNFVRLRHRRSVTFAHYFVNTFLLWRDCRSVLIYAAFRPEKMYFPTYQKSHKYGCSSVEFSMYPYIILDLMIFVRGNDYPPHRTEVHPTG